MMKLNIFYSAAKNYSSHLLVTIVFGLIFTLKPVGFNPPFQTEEDFLPTPLVKLTSLGYPLAAVDWFWIQTLQIVGANSYDPAFIPRVNHFYQVATDLDPKFYELYEQAGVLLSFFFKSPDDGIRFLELGIQNQNPSWNRPYTLYLLTAYLYAYEKNDWVKAKAYYLKAAELKGAPSYLQNMKVWLQEKNAEKTLAKRVLGFLIRDTKDSVLLEQYQKKLEALN